MMKNITIKFVFICMIATLSYSCSDEFIQDKKDYTSVNLAIYEDEYLANSYLDYLYYSMLPDDNPNMVAWSKAGEEHSSPDLFAKSTDQLAGLADLNREYDEISDGNDHCLKSLGERIEASAKNNAYTRIRYCNLYLEFADEYSTLDEDFLNQVKGQFYFWRAWQYFELLRLYGGVPLVLSVQGANVDDPSVQTPRSPASKVLEQIVTDLEMSQTLLENARPYTADQAGRITASAASALKGRVLLTWASPQFNKSDDQSRWQRAYDANLNAYNVCLSSGKGLDPDWQNMWFKDNGMESIFSFGFNNVTGAVARNNYTEHRSRSRDQGATTSPISPTKNVMDAFPMSDGTPYDPNGNLNNFYKNRDPRFYYTFAYNGSIWPYAQNPNYRNWTYFWYPLTAEPGKPILPTNISQNNSGVYLRKFTNPTSSNDNAFQVNGADYMEIRFAEVVLNLAESAIGINKLAEGKGYIGNIRERAGIQNLDGQYGLASLTTRDQLFGAVINERKVEFAYENKRFHDLRRWELYNDSFGTCTRLNQKPIEGSRRQGYITIVKRDANTIYEAGGGATGGVDPLKGQTAILINRDATTYPSGINTYEEYVDYLYDNHFEVRVRDDLDPSGFTFTWFNEYYFFGIYQNLLNTAPYLQQTQGWGGSFVPYN